MHHSLNSHLHTEPSQILLFNLLQAIRSKVMELFRQKKIKIVGMKDLSKRNL